MTQPILQLKELNIPIHEFKYSAKISEPFTIYLKYTSTKKLTISHPPIQSKFIINNYEIFSGIITSITTDFKYHCKTYYYTLILNPILSYLQYISTPKVYAKAQKIQIIKEVLKQARKDLGKNFKYQIQANLNESSKSIQIQYKENDLEFIQQLINPNIIYYFNSDGVVFIDTPHKLPHNKTKFFIGKHSQRVEFNSRFFSSFRAINRAQKNKIEINNFTQKYSSTLTQQINYVDAQTKNTMNSSINNKNNLFEAKGNYFLTAGQIINLEGNRYIITKSSCRGLYKRGKAHLNTSLTLCLFDIHNNWQPDLNIKSSIPSHIYGNQLQKEQQINTKGKFAVKFGDYFAKNTPIISLKDKQATIGFNAGASHSSSEPGECLLTHQYGNENTLIIQGYLSNENNSALITQKNEKHIAINSQSGTNITLQHKTNKNLYAYNELRHKENFLRLGSYQEDQNTPYAKHGIQINSHKSAKDLIEKSYQIKISKNSQASYNLLSDIDKTNELIYVNKYKLQHIKKYSEQQSYNSIFKKFNLDFNKQISGKKVNNLDNKNTNRFLSSNYLTIRNFSSKTAKKYMEMELTNITEARLSKDIGNYKTTHNGNIISQLLGFNRINYQTKTYFHKELAKNKTSIYKQKTKLKYEGSKSKINYQNLNYTSMNYIFSGISITENITDTMTLKSNTSIKKCRYIGVISKVKVQTSNIEITQAKESKVHAKIFSIT